jgi:predicted kinase
MRLTNFITESINDKGILKAVFFVGPPGSGKTTIIDKIWDGSLPIAVISTDIWTEFFGKIGKSTEWSIIGKPAKHLTVTNIINKINGLFPVYVDTTGADIGRFEKRVDFLRDIGYDISLVIVDVSFDTSNSRVSLRNKNQERQVSQDFVDQYYNIMKSVPKFKSIIPDNITIHNDILSDSDAIKAYNIVMKKLTSSVSNDKGKILVDFMKKSGYTYYSDIPEKWKKENNYPILDSDIIQWFNK